MSTTRRHGQHPLRARRHGADRKGWQVRCPDDAQIRGKRSKTDTVDNDPRIPEALETARALDEEFARTGRLKGPLHSMVFDIKDQFDAFDMRSRGTKLRTMSDCHNAKQLTG
jgi:hypothetical protein